MNNVATLPTVDGMVNAMGDVVTEVPISVAKLKRMETDCAMYSALLEVGLLQSDVYFAALNKIAADKAEDANVNA